MLVETHSWRDYPHRVKTTHDVVLSVVRQIAAHGKDWMQVAQAADARSLAGQPVPLDYAPTTRCARSISSVQLHAHAVRHLRRADDALRRDEAGGLAHPAARRRAAGARRTRRARATSCRRAGRVDRREAQACTASVSTVDHADGEARRAGVPRDETQFGAASWKATSA
jgi:hypothetical protein